MFWADLGIKKQQQEHKEKNALEITLKTSLTILIKEIFCPKHKASGKSVNPRESLMSWQDP